MSTKRKPKMGAPVKYTDGVKLRAIKVPLTDEEFERVKLVPPGERAERLLKQSASVYSLGGALPGILSD